MASRGHVPVFKTLQSFEIELETWIQHSTHNRQPNSRAFEYAFVQLENGQWQWPLASMVILWLGRQSWSSCGRRIFYQMFMSLSTIWKVLPYCCSTWQGYVETANSRLCTQWRKFEMDISSWVLTLAEVHFLYWKLGVNRSIKYKKIKFLNIYWDINIFFVIQSLTMISEINLAIYSKFLSDHDMVW